MTSSYSHDQRVVILAPRGRDATVVAQVLATEGMRSVICTSIEELVVAMQAGSAMVFVTEEALEDDQLPLLSRHLDTQPPWSDMPFVVLAMRQSRRRSRQAAERLQGLGNLVVLERPLNAETLISAARSAARARNRQYQLRSHLEEQVRINLENQRLYQAEWRALSEATEARAALALALSAAELGTFHCPLPDGAVEWSATCKAHYWLEPGAPVDFSLFYSLVHDDDRAHVRAMIEASLEQDRPYDAEYRTVGPAGQYRWIRAKGRAYRDDEGRPTRFDGITIDISAQKLLEAQLQALLDVEKSAREESERVGRLKDEFLATLSHELRTPLSAILGWTHLLRSKSMSPEAQAQAAETIERNAQAQARLIEEMLDVSRIVAGSLHLDLEWVDPRKVIDSAILSVKPAAAAKSITLSTEFGAGIGSVHADPHRLQQIFWNLLSNAVKFTPANGQVTVSLRVEGDVLEFEVRDTGEGIRPEFLTHVFDRFRQADASTTRLHGGLGLGLAIVRHLIELHGGSVTASSAGLGQGSCFTVRLPTRATDAAGEPGGAAWDAAGPPAAKAARLDGVVIVTVDDERDGSELVHRILGDYGAVVVTAQSAAEALRAMRDHHPDLLISDIAMPDVDGYELVRRVHAMLPGLPAIALTAFARDIDREKALAAGFRLHLSKPFAPEALLAAVTRLLADAPKPTLAAQDAL